ncbi:SDR family oxidoreductase [Parasediminibacterium sp. JCM 36343]|uniref:SDR family oxidoreductase n=1 Tax=Parasediminibacterium sp. JCM 36343 TaxID=3374279 RepID=UPI00397C2872
MASLFANRVAVVTGAGSGIGQATALAYAAGGAKVIVSDIKENDTVAKIKANGGEATFIKTDVSKAAECEHLVKQTIDIYGKIDIAFNNAGILGETNQLAEMSLAGFEKVISVNLNGVFYCMKYEIDAMLKQGGGVIVNTASILGAVGFMSFSGYVAAKHGVVGLTQNAAMEYSKKGIRINCVAPGFINTPLLNDIDKAGKEALELKHPIGRLGTSEEVAALVIWLSSSQASFATGGYYPIDGGYLTA